MGSNNSSLSDSAGRLTFPSVVCVCCESSYLDQTDETLGENADNQSETAESWTADCADDQKAS